MNDELPDLFGDVAPRPAPAELRSGVLAAVGRELARPRKPRWERMMELAVAASLVLGIGWNVWLARSDATWRERVFGPGQQSAALAEVGGNVASAVEPPAEKTLGQRLSSVWLSKPDWNAEPFRRYRQVLDEMKNETGQLAL